ncbi:phage tail tape measure protein [Salimicrobium album]|uniref:Phage tail tape measure protein, TP901 family, core region n=1 Tax=Salimicrobium album TaxID=50717 RepID=A0A1H3DFS0_9BACI|nr:phage tail tape measure protein [Salimicrobium album]SDX65313.1 phage tail tape measure protein, TP901 family, core region [Salimicrobium album]
MADRIEGLSIGLDLDKAGIDRSLTEIKRSFKGLNSTVKTNANNLKYGEKSVSNYEKAVASLNEDVTKQRKNVSDLADKHAKAVEEQGRNSKAANDLAGEYNKQADNLNRMERQLENTTEDLKKMKEQQRIAASGWTKLGDKMESAGSKLTNVGDKMKNTGKSMAMFVTAPLIGLGAAAVKTGIDFDDSMAKVQAVSGATSGDMEQLRNKAKEMGKTTKFSASESADALNYMALAGFDTKQMMGALPGVMNLAAASGEDLSSVSDIVTDSLSAFGLKAKDSAKMADVLAATSANANTDVAGLGNAFKYVAPVAGSLGFTMQDTSKAIGLMANNGIKGEKAGTALRTMMTNLAKPTSAMKDKMQQLGISLTNSEGEMKTFDQIMQELRGSFSGLSKEQQASAAATIFGKEAMSGALSVINTSQEDYDKLSGSISKSEGAAQKMSETMEGQLGGTLRRIKSGLEGFAISIYEIMRPALEKGAEKVQQFVNWLNDLSPKFKIVALAVAGFGAAIGPLLVAGGLLVGLLGNMMTALAPVARSIAKAGGMLKWLRLGLTALTGPVGITIGIIASLAAGFTLAYKKSETFRNFINRLMSKIKELAQQGLAKLKEALKVVVTFFKDQLQVLREFWRKNEATIVEALTNIGNIVSKVMKAIFAVIDFVMPAVLALIKSVWGNIKGVISGALDVIMGLVKVFAGLFTGNFSKMWEGIKQVFTGALQGIWNFVQLMFWGKLLKGVVSLGKLLLSSFKGSWKSILNAITGFVKNIVSGVRNRFSAMGSWISNTFSKLGQTVGNIWSFLKNSVINIVKNLVSGARNRFSNFVSRIGDMFRGFWQTVKNIWTSLKDGVVNIVRGLVRTVQYRIKKFQHLLRSIFRAIRDKVQSIWTNLKDRVVSTAQNLVDTAKNKFQSFKDKVGSIFRGIRDKTKEYVGNMVQAVKDMPGRMKDGLVKMGGKVKSGAKSIANKMAEGLGKGVNGVIDGVNWVTGKLGINADIPNWDVPKYAHGTGKHPGGAAWVGDGKGSNAGRELIKHGNDYALSPDRPTLTNLPKGAEVLSAKETRKIIPEYAFGTNLWSGAKNLVGKIGSGIKAGANAVKDWTGQAWDYMKNPGKLLNIALNKLGIEIPSTASAIGKMAKGGFNTVKDKAIDYIKDKMSGFGGGGTSGGGRINAGLTKTSSFGMRFHPIQKRWKLHGGDDYGGPMGTPIPAQTGGRVSYAGWGGGFGNLVKVATGAFEHLYAHLNSISVRTGQMIKRGSIVGRLGTTGNSTGPHLHYEVRKNGRAVRPTASYATGGLIKKQGMYELAEEGHPEYVIPTDPKRRTEAMKLLALAGKDINRTGSRNKRPSELRSSNVGQSDNRSNEIIEKLSEQVELLTQLVLKDNNVYLDGRSVGRQIEPAVTEFQNRNRERRD